MPVLRNSAGRTTALHRSLASRYRSRDPITDPALWETAQPENQSPTGLAARLWDDPLLQGGRAITSVKRRESTSLQHPMTTNDLPPLEHQAPGSSKRLEATSTLENFRSLLTESKTGKWASSTNDQRQKETMQIREWATWASPKPMRRSFRTPARSSRQPRVSPWVGMWCPFEAVQE